MFIVLSLIIFVQENYTITKSCGCETSLYLILLALASLGLFSGSITYYFHSKAVEKDQIKHKKLLIETLNFLDSDEKNIVNHLINNKGEDYQSKLASKLKMSNVKLHRRLKNLEAKQIIYKTSKGMTHKIKLNDNLKKLFL